MSIFKKISYIFKNLSSPGKTLSSKAVKGGFWVFSLRIIDRAFQFARTVVLARLLSPEDFGLFGIALLVLSILDTFTESGFQQAIIQKKGETRRFLDTAWTIGLIRGLTVAVIVFFLAKPASNFFNAQAAEPILRVIGASIILRSLTNISVLYFKKELEFKKYFKYQFSGTIVDVIVTIITALLLKSVWALIFGLLAGSLVRCIMSYVIEPYKPNLKINIRKAKELFGFGKWILGTSIITFLFNHGDDGFAGKILGITTLGFYQMAFRISQLPVTEYAKILSQITFPTYSKVQNNYANLKKGFLKTLNITTLLVFPLVGGILILAPEFTYLFLGDEWLPIISILRILALGGMARALITTGGALFSGVGLPNLDFKMNIIRLTVMIITIYPLTLFFGINGVALSVALGDFAPIPMWFTWTSKITKASLKDYFKIINVPFLGTIILCIPLLFLKWKLDINIPIFILMVLIGIGFYIGFLYILEKRFNSTLLKELKSLIGFLRER